MKSLSLLANVLTLLFIMIPVSVSSMNIEPESTCNLNNSESICNLLEKCLALT